ncbi:MAG: glycine cleavage system aminomethyltransferase GcvT [Pseudohongiellaceae bacterium]
MARRTALYQKHIDAGARMVDFAGWEMPINYGSQIDEHHLVRQQAGVFDVSHMTVVDVSGADAEAYLRRLLANDVARLKVVGKALYSAMLNTNGGVIDDLIVYRLRDGYRLVVNCATRSKDLAWLELQSQSFRVQLLERPELAILAVHGPASIEKVCAILPAAEAQKVKELANFHGVELEGDWFVARTGYTGEKGVELIFPEQQAESVWDRLLAAGVSPVGLGARDTLRLEAGMNLYGHDMDESVSPLAANMEPTIAWEAQDRDFIGRSALLRQQELQRQGLIPQLVGLVLEERGVLREGQTVVCDEGEGVITSGTYSPTLKHSIALARIPASASNCRVDIRGKLLPVRIVKPNFVRFGQKVFD